MLLLVGVRTAWPGLSACAKGRLREGARALSGWARG